jgi:hypothetical protein
VADTAWSNDRSNVLATLARIERAVETLDHSIHGNGEPGLKGEVAALKAERESRQWRNRLIVGALVAALATATVINGVAAVKLYAMGNEQVK